MSMSIRQRRLCQILAVSSIGVWGTSVGAAQQVRPLPELTVGRLADGGERPVIDGRVDEAIWSTAQPFGAFIQQEPDEGEPATERTEIRFLLDRQNFYVGVISFDSEPDKIIVSQSRRDAELVETDSIEILLDTFNDGQNAFVFGTNPFGIEYDGQVTAEGQGGQRGRAELNLNWNADWTVRARVTAGRRNSAFRSRRCGTTRGTSASGGSTPCATSGGRTSRSSCRQCPGATTSTACRSPASWAV
jgi:hypothetical protein